MTLTLARSEDTLELRTTCEHELAHNLNAQQLTTNANLDSAVGKLEPAATLK